MDKLADSPDRGPTASARALDNPIRRTGMNKPTDPLERGSRISDPGTSDPIRKRITSVQVDHPAVSHPERVLAVGEMYPLPRPTRVAVYELLTNPSPTPS